MDLFVISLGFIVLLTLIHRAQTQDMYAPTMHYLLSLNPNTIVGTHANHSVTTILYIVGKFTGKTS